MREMMLLAEGTTSMPWPPNTMSEAVIATVLFGSIGILLALAGFKLFDLVTPGKLQVEILEKNNTSAAIITAAFILGVCYIIATVVG